MRRMSLVLCHLDGDTDLASRTSIRGTRDEKLLSLGFDFKLLSRMNTGWDGDIKELGPGFRFRRMGTSRTCDTHVMTTGRIVTTGMMTTGRMMTTTTGSMMTTTTTGRTH